MYTSPPPIPRSTLQSLMRTFVGRNVVAGIKYGAGAGAGYGCLAGTLIAPIIGTIYGLVIGLVVGLGAGLSIGIATAIILSLITAAWFRPIRNVQVYRGIVGIVSVLITFAGVFLLGWLIEPGKLMGRLMGSFSGSDRLSLIIFVVGPAFIGSFYNWKASQQLAQWYESERTYEPVQPAPVPPIHTEGARRAMIERG